ncbi:hypothetical protein AB0D24_32125 [Streptomyces javensis]|uniref:hypothetical protein n=1 Tax=Streptomyces javensis TaxID=114698 RepID=UPI0033DAE33C
MAERTAAARGGAVIGAAEVSAVRDMVGLFAEMDERLGGQHGRAVFVMRTMSQQGMKLHRPGHCLDLAASGLARANGQVPAHARALFHITHAHALARLRKGIP